MYLYVSFFSIQKVKMLKDAAVNSICHYRPIKAGLSEQQKYLST